MSHSPTSDDSFPLLRTMTVLSVASVGIYVLVRLVFAWLAPDLARAGHAIDIAALVVWGAALLGVLPMALVWRAGLMPIVVAYFAGSAVRIMLVLAATVLVLWRTDWPPVAWVATLFVMYLSLLLLEVALVGKRIWNKRLDGFTSSGPSSHRDPAREDDAPHGCQMEACA